MTAPRINLSVPDNSLFDKGRNGAWRAMWFFLGAPLLKSYLLPFSALKVALLRLFGAGIGRGVYWKPGTRVKFPWYLTVGDHCWIGEDVWIDNLTHVRIGSHVCVSQGAYLCTGNHDWSASNMKLFTGPITLRDGSWVGARSTVCPGVTLEYGAVLAMGGVATKPIAPMEIWAGNPAQFYKKRSLLPQR